MLNKVRFKNKENLRVDLEKNLEGRIKDELEAIIYF